MEPTSAQAQNATPGVEPQWPESRAYVIDGNHIRANGKRLAALALVGQVIALFKLISTPLVLYWAQRPSVEGKPPLAFLMDTYVFGPTATYNLHGILLIAAFFVLLECLRRLGISMRNDMPLGGETTRRIGALRWIVVPLALLACIKIDLAPTMDAGALVSYQPTYDFNVDQLYFALLALAGLSLVHRIVRHAVALHAENESFI